MATIAVTGVGGFIGSRFAEIAIERGHKVRGLELSTEGCDRAEALGVDVRLGDIRDEDALRWLYKGADSLLHTVAVVGEDGDFGKFWEINVEGTRRVCRMAAEAAVPRIVHLSSVMVHGFSYPPNVAEDEHISGDGNPYCETKIESEYAAMSAHAPGKTDVVILRPGDVYGAGSEPWVRRPIQLMRKGLFMLPGAGDGVMNHVYVDNLADAIFLALETDATGQAFTVTDGQTTSVTDYFGRLSAMVGRREPRHLPVPVAKALFAAVAMGAERLGVEPPARASAVDFINRHNAYSIRKARDVLGYTPKVPFSEGMARVRRDLQVEGYI